MKLIKLFLFVFLFAFSYSFTQAQYKKIDEYEASIGYLNLQGDLGVRGNFNTTLGSSGGTATAKIYFNFNDPYDFGRTYLGKHIRYHLSLDMGYTTLKPNDKELLYGPKVNAIIGQMYFFAIGANMEYHITNLREVSFFSSSFFTNFDPYVGIGIQGDYYNVEVESALGNFEKTPDILPRSYIGNVKNGSRFSPALNIETGLRYRFSDDLQFSLKSNWVFFINDDYVDGIRPDPKMVENFYNDWLLKTQFGVVIFIK